MNIVCAALLLRPYKSNETDDNNKALNASNAENGSMYKPTASISKNSTHGSLETISDVDGEYLETCPIFHDVDTQSIYGFDVVLHPLTNSDEIIWKDCKFNFLLQISLN